MMGLLRKLAQLEIGHVFGSGSTPEKGGYVPAGAAAAYILLLMAR